jgi:hypothetical protein
VSVYLCVYAYSRHLLRPLLPLQKSSSRQTLTFLHTRNTPVSQNPPPPPPPPPHNQSHQGLAAALRIRQSTWPSTTIHTLWLRHDGDTWDGVSSLLGTGAFDRLRTLGIVARGANPQGCIALLAAFHTQGAERRTADTAVMDISGGIEELRLDLQTTTTTTAAPSLDLGPFIPRLTSFGSSLLRSLRALGIAHLDARTGLPSLGRLLVHLPNLTELTLGFPEVTAFALDRLGRSVLASPSYNRGRALRTLQFKYPHAPSAVAAEAASAALGRALAGGAFPNLEALVVWYDFNHREPACVHGRHFLGGDTGLCHLYMALLRRQQRQQQRQQRQQQRQQQGEGHGLKWLRVGCMSPAMAERLVGVLAPDGVLEEAELGL